MQCDCRIRGTCGSPLYGDGSWRDSPHHQTNYCLTTYCSPLDAFLRFACLILVPLSHIVTALRLTGTPCYLLLTTHYSLLTTHYSLLNARYSLPASHSSKYTAHCLPLTVHCPLCTAHYSFLTIDPSLFTLHSLPFPFYCALLLIINYSPLTTRYYLYTAYYPLLPGQGGPP